MTKKYAEEDYLMLSGIEHFVFCRRQWAIIHIEQHWADNEHTIEGNIVHENAHDSSFNEKRGDLITIRGLQVFSSELGVNGECDVVEFRRVQRRSASSNGSGTEVKIPGREGYYTVTPIEYKKGSPKENDCDIMQLAAQAMCLEEMLCCEIPVAYMYYDTTKHRLKVEINDELRAKTIDTIRQMHELYSRRHTPKVKRTKACNACSVKNYCLPVLCASNKRASDYVQKMIDDMGDTAE